MKITITLLCICFIAGCAVVRETGNTSKSGILVEENLFVGRWTGHTYYPVNNVYMEWVSDQRADGTYSTLFTEYYVDGIRKDPVYESGKWWLEDGFYHEINPEIMTKPDVYRILLINEEVMIYQLISTDITALYVEQALEPKIFIQKRVK